MEREANYLCVCVCECTVCVPLQWASNHTLWVRATPTFGPVSKNNIKTSYVTGWSRHDETWWNNPAGCPLPFCSAIGTFYYFPLDIDFLSSLLNLWGQRAGLCFFLLLPVNTISQRTHPYTQSTHSHIHTHTTNTVCTCTYKVHMQTHTGSIPPLEELIRESMGPDSEQEKFPQSCEIGHTSAHVSAQVFFKADVTAAECWAPKRMDPVMTLSLHAHTQLKHRKPQVNHCHWHPSRVAFNCRK